jgi:Fms-interacting protein/Thoc5
MRISNTRTLYTDVDLIGEEEFLELHPEFIGLEGYDLMMKRLEDEAEQRVELEARRKELVNRRATTQLNNSKRKADLDNLTETLKKFIEVSYLWILKLMAECYAYLRSISEVLTGLEILQGKLWA